MYSRTSEIETADLSQSHAGLNLSQFQTDCLSRMNSRTAILNYFESILGIVTTLENEKYWYFTLLKTINCYAMHSLFFNNDECITCQFKNLYKLISSIKRMFQLYLVAVLEFL